MTTVHAFPSDWTMSRVIYTGAAIIAGGAMLIGSAAFLADGARNTSPAAGPTAVVATQEPGRLVPRCFETSTAGAQDCAWVPVAPCLTDEAGDEAIPNNYDGCYWDAESRGNRTGTSYVIWRGGRG